MDRAFELAFEALEAKEVPVGCVIIYENETIGEGRNRVNEFRNATKHAEILAVDMALDWSKKSNFQTCLARILLFQFFYNLI